MINDITLVFKKRWPEILLIVGFMVMGMFLLEQIGGAVMPAGADGAGDDSSVRPIAMTETTSFLFSMVSVFFLITSQIFTLGFLATLNVNYTEQHDPMILLRIGRIFFWRVFRFQLLFGIYCLAVAAVISLPFTFMFFRGVSPEDVPPWIKLFSLLAASVVLVKPMVLIQPIMISRNLMVLPAVRALPEYNISDIAPLAVVYIVGITAAGVIGILQSVLTPWSTAFYIAFSLKALIAAFVVVLLPGMMGIWYVAAGRFGRLASLQEEEDERGEEG